jgi:hypothetical protein
MNNTEVLKRAAELYRRLAEESLDVRGSEYLADAAALERMAEQEPAAWQVRNGLVHEEFFRTKDGADDCCKSSQRVHDLSGSWAGALAERDEMEERATALAEAVGEYVGVDVGEWSSANDPISAAMEAMAAQPQQAPEGWQFVPKAELLRIARLIEDLKRPCSDDPESPQAIRNGRYQSIALLVRAMLAVAPKWEVK